MRSHFRNRSGATRRDGWGLPDPHQPGSPQYAERTQVREVEIVGFHPGTMRVDVGGDLAPKPVVTAEPLPVVPATVLGMTAAPTVPEPNFKPGLGKHRRGA